MNLFSKLGKWWEIKRICIYNESNFVRECKKNEKQKNTQNARLDELNCLWLFGMGNIHVRKRKWWCIRNVMNVTNKKIYDNFWILRRLKWIRLSLQIDRKQKMTSKKHRIVEKSNRNRRSETDQMNRFCGLLTLALVTLLSQAPVTFVCDARDAIRSNCTDDYSISDRLRHTHAVEKRKERI